MVGMTHLLPKGDVEVPEVKMACFMGLVSQFAAKPEVLRVAPLHSMQELDAITAAVMESASIVNTPLRGAGLDGTGEVIQAGSTLTYS